MDIKAIFFDTSNTLYNSPELEEEMKATPINFIMHQKGVSEEKALSIFEIAKIRAKEKGILLTKTNVLIEAGFSNSDYQNFNATINTGLYLSPIKENVDTLTWLSTKCSLGVITNINNKFLQNVLRSLGFSDNLFSYFVTADDVSKSKPDLEPFLMAIKKSKLKPKQILYVGDQVKKDMEPAKRVGMKTALVDYKGQYSNSDGDIVDYCIGNLVELRSVINYLWDMNK